MSIARLARAVAAGNPEAVAPLLAADVVLVSDGGGRVLVPTQPVEGVDGVARLVAVLGTTGRSVTVEQVNGHAGLLVRRGGRAEAVLALTCSERGITRIWLVLNPDKLTRWHAEGLWTGCSLE